MMDKILDISDRHPFVYIHIQLLQGKKAEKAVLQLENRITNQKKETVLEAFWVSDLQSEPSQAKGQAKQGNLV